ncbi:MAG: PUA domain-containing protein [Nanoarchaeota archaeon]
MKKRRLRKSEIKELSSKLHQLYGTDFDKKEELEEAIIGNIKTIMKDKTPIFFFYKDTPIPTLKKCIENCFLKKIIVDMGAIKFVTSGADIMRPGITELDENIKPEEFAVVVDENNQKPLAIVRALYSGQKIKEMEKGKVLENIHYIGDDIWRIHQ